MKEVTKRESQATSALAFVEGGIQDSSDDSCSICLETFSESDPSTATHCKHGFHLQCILEWCQRSSNCPMCWQTIKMEDSESQDLLEAVEHERNINSNPPRTASIVYHPAQGNIEFPHFAVGISNSELEERVIHRLAAAAAMGRTHRNQRREGSTNPVVGSSSASVNMLNSYPEISVGSSSSGKSSMTNQERAAPDFQKFSDTLSSRFASMSMKYRESFSKSKKGWMERLFS
ncbi:unnamed protein product [Cuscuta epithymum]|uniref:RING-type E3 ubiquitin transferase n=1 Tax=Cuscuta epithymum TaxID=186058 RepID=A0AAV0DEG1_9ASTE|nr:unnamed protein product [Cuscuta epithymum]